ncbi:hypothetical protein ACTXGL_01620 [Psychrobacter sp. T6-6]|uniref:hypothetical protein n=1 Tax=Psychrobacter sp. T6-6 TaxID=3457452 RepID=UPI003FD0CDE3
MTNGQIKEIALANGFKLKEQPSGEMDLNPYVYSAIRNAILFKLGQITADMADLIDSKDTLESQSMLDRCDDIIDKHIAELSEVTDD